MSPRPGILLAAAIVVGVTLRGSCADQTATATSNPPLLSRTADGTVAMRGLAAVIHAGVVPAWPVELLPLATARKACTAGPCTEWQRLEVALNHAAEWMAAFPQGPLRFDAAMVLSQVRLTVDSNYLRIAFKRARAVADRDDDHPQRRFWIPGFYAPAEHTSRWPVPTEPGQRVNTNRVVSEALYCKEHGWRPETMRYLCGPMRDGGGYQSTHALWALYIAQRNGCVGAADYEPCARALQRELAETQPAAFEPHATLDIDLYTERLQSVVLTGYPDALVNQWARVLIGLQSPDGSWGIPAAGEDPYYRYHATMVATWALAEWYRRVVEHPEVRPFQ